MPSQKLEVILGPPSSLPVPPSSSITSFCQRIMFPTFLPFSPHSAHCHQRGQPRPFGPIITSKQPRWSPHLHQSILHCFLGEHPVSSPLMALQSLCDKLGDCSSFYTSPPSLPLCPLLPSSCLGQLLPSTRSSAPAPSICKRSLPFMLIRHAGHRSRQSSWILQPQKLATLNRTHQPMAATLQAVSHPQGAERIQREQLCVCAHLAHNMAKLGELGAAAPGIEGSSLRLLRVCLFTVGRFPTRT